MFAKKRGDRGTSLLRRTDLTVLHRRLYFDVSILTIPVWRLSVLPKRRLGQEPISNYKAYLSYGRRTSYGLSGSRIL